MRRSSYSTYSVSSPKPWLKWGGAVLIFGAFAALMWFATSSKDSLIKNENDLELILPIAGPVKVRANDPGGMKIANKDKEVFNLLSGESGDNIEAEDLCNSVEGEMVCNKSLPKITNLAANPEEAKKKSDENKLHPKPKSADIAMLISDYELKNNKPKKSVENKKEKEVKIASKVKKDKAVLNNKKELVAVKTISKEKLFTGNAWGIQLASYKSLKGADNGSKIYLKKFPELLKSLTYVTERVDIKNKGTFYRVQFIGLKDKMSAKKVCDKFKAKGQGCWYVSR